MNFVTLFNRSNEICSKSQDGKWREYTNLQEVNFEQFPDFDPTSGLTGQTLVFNLKTNKLEIVYEQDEDYHGLCYRQKWGGRFCNFQIFKRTLKKSDLKFRIKKK